MSTRVLMFEYYFSRDFSSATFALHFTVSSFDSVHSIWKISKSRKTPDDWTTSRMFNVGGVGVEVWLMKFTSDAGAGRFWEIKRRTHVYVKNNKVGISRRRLSSSTKLYRFWTRKIFMLWTLKFCSISNFVVETKIVCFICYIYILICSFQFVRIIKYVVNFSPVDSGC